jgi:hypothetical protein
MRRYGNRQKSQQSGQKWKKGKRKRPHLIYVDATFAVRIPSSILMQLERDLLK